ncbi:MAG TPA: flagellar biosynthesis regulator FlaF [Beijerinckiaceae bacterium]|nr:flagellar biosynthesis regulator FlaF [Beijerinckiaceae bacterium]
MPLKIELKPGERLILGGCVVINDGRRTRLAIEGAMPVLREKDIMTARQANSPAKRLYLAVQRMYTSMRTQENYADYCALTRGIVEAAPCTRRFIDGINNRMLTGELYEALKETRKLIAYEKELLKVNYAVQAYARAANDIAGPRELEASLLLQAAAKLQAVQSSWKEKPGATKEAVLFNRRLWTVFLDSLIQDKDRLPQPLRENLKTLGAFVMCETFSLVTKPQQKHFENLININRRIAAGLRKH